MLQGVVVVSWDRHRRVQYPEKKLVLSGKCAFADERALVLSACEVFRATGAWSGRKWGDTPDSPLVYDERVKCVGVLF